MAELTLKANGRTWSGWTEIRVSRGLGRAVSDFEISVTERWQAKGEPWQLRAQMPCSISIDNKRILTGYIDGYYPSFDANTHGVRITGRSKTADLVDCAALVKGGQFKGYDLAAIARALAKPFDIDVEVEADVGASFPDVQIQPGETCFEVIERLCRLRAVLASDDEWGRLVLTQSGKAGAQRAEPLVQGQNITGGSAGLDHSGRYSEYHVRGQQAGSENLFGTQASEPAAQVTDATVTRYRPHLVIAEAQGDSGAFNKRARWERAIAVAKSALSDIEVNRWLQKDGTPWQTGALAEIDAPWLRLDQNMEIETVVFRKDNNGEYAQLGLVIPGALTPQPVSESSGSPGRGAAYDIKAIEG